MERFETMLREVREFERRNGIEVVLQESLPRSDGKGEAEAFQRFGIVRDSYKDVARPTTLDETKTHPRVVEIPAGMHQKLAESISGPAPAVEATVYTKLSNALSR